MARAVLETDPVRSAMMAKVRQSGTAPELAVRAILREIGVAYRIGGRGLPGRPDLCNRSRRWAIFVHGCYWHRHRQCARTPPRRNTGYWTAKFETNRARDARAVRALRAMGFRVLIVWECELRKRRERVAHRLERMLAARPARGGDPRAPARALKQSAPPDASRCASGGQGTTVA